MTVAIDVIKSGEVTGSNKETEQVAWEQELAGAPLTPQLFGRLYDAFFPRIYNYLSYRTTSREEAEDLTSQVFERVITRYHQFDARRGSFESWIFAIARHTLSNQSRHKIRHPQTELDEYIEDSHEVGPTEHVLKQEELYRLQQYITRLGERDRELIALRFGASLSQRRIGELLGMSEGSVAVALSRALRRLRRLFEGEEVV
jgi:RNA polymerase sigma-70 factor (ECF subfamily)